MQEITTEKEKKDDEGTAEPKLEVKTEGANEPELKTEGASKPELKTEGATDKKKSGQTFFVLFLSLRILHIMELKTLHVFYGV